jgi:hypothetical protein
VHGSVFFREMRYLFGVLSYLQWTLQILKYGTKYHCSSPMETPNPKIGYKILLYQSKTVSNEKHIGVPILGPTSGMTHKWSCPAVTHSLWAPSLSLTRFTVSSSFCGAGVEIHCEGCIDHIKSRISKIKGEFVCFLCSPTVSQLESLRNFARLN